MAELLSYCTRTSLRGVDVPYGGYDLWPTLTYLNQNNLDTVSFPEHILENSGRFFYIARTHHYFFTYISQPKFFVDQQSQSIYFILHRHITEKPLGESVRRCAVCVHREGGAGDYGCLWPLVSDGQKMKVHNCQGNFFTAITVIS